MERHTLRRVGLGEILRPELRAGDPSVDEVARAAIDDVRTKGEAGLRLWAERLGELGPADSLIVGRDGLERAASSLDEGTRGLLARAHERIRSFAAAQRACLGDLDMAVPGGRAGHRFVPVARAGCYVPGGRYPLPSSALMTVTAAKAAGVPEVWCAGPRPSAATLAAAFIAGADGFLRCGGAQAVAALAFGSAVPPCEIVVGPGGRYVASAKRQLFGLVGTEAPAGPSELLVIAVSGSGYRPKPSTVAADLLAQAEHDTEARVSLIASDEDFVREVELALDERIPALPEPNRDTASSALRRGWAFVSRDFAEIREAAERCAPEHLQILAPDPWRYAAAIGAAGEVFLGEASAEAMGDYGAGPNHCLPTGGAARFAAGLSVLHFLRARTWLSLDDPSVLAGDAAAFARLEGLEAHARSAELRGALAAECRGASA